MERKKYDQELDAAFVMIQAGFVALAQRIAVMQQEEHTDPEHDVRLQYAAIIFNTVNAVFEDDIKNATDAAVQLAMAQLTTLTKVGAPVRKAPDTLVGFDAVERSFDQLIASHFWFIGTLHERFGKNEYVPILPYYGAMIWAYDLFFLLESGSYTALSHSTRNLLESLQSAARAA